MRSDRLLSILLLLQARGRVTAPALAAELEVSVRTVHRDIEALSAAGVPVYTERGRHGGCVLLPGYRTDVTGLTTGEAQALFVFAGSGVLGEVGLEPALRSGLRKLLAAMPAPRRPEVEQARERVVVDPRGWMRSPEPLPAMDVVQDALWRDRRLRMHYRRRDDPGSRRYTVDPYGLVTKAGTWYLLAAHRGTVKMFRVSRVESATALDAASARPPDLDLDALWARLRDRVEVRTGVLAARLLVDPGTWRLLHGVLRAQLVAEPVLHPEVDGLLPVDAVFRGLRPARMLLGFGTAVRVLSPPELVAELAGTAAAVVVQYEGAAS